MVEEVLALPLWSKGRAFAVPGVSAARECAPPPKKDAVSAAGWGPALCFTLAAGSYTFRVDC